MGRGRAKAKQTKVARDLKYRTFNTDFTSLERELRANQPADDDSNYDELAEKYADYLDEDDDDAEGVRHYG